MNNKSQNLKLEITQLTGMPLNEALAVIWPFRGIRKPIGISLKEGDITYSDIAWASENAFDLRIKRASQTILVSHWLPENLKPSLLPAQVIQGPSYTSSQQRTAIENKSLVFGVVFGMGLFFISVYAVVLITNQMPVYKESISNIYGILFFIFLPLFLSWVGSKYASESEMYRIGEEAENQSVNALHALLHQPWTVIHNFVFPDRKWGDIDLIVIGPGGIWAVEVKGYTSSIRNIGDKWQYKNRFGWRKLGSHPGKQARRNAKRLYDYLDLKGITPTWVQPVVLWAGEDIQIENPETPVWKLSELPNTIDFWKGSKLSEEQIDRIKSILQDGLLQSRNKND